MYYCYWLPIGTFFVYSQRFPKNTSTTPTATSGSVGHITFIHDPNTPKNTYNQLQIMLNNLPAPPAGKSYYAWLVSSNNESIFPLDWELQLSNGAVTYLTPVDTNHSDLYPKYTQFLVTLEDTGAPNAIPDPVARFYYAILSPTSSSSPTFEVKPCPTSGANPCISGRFISDAGIGVVGPFQLDGVVAYLFCFPGADIADFAVVLIVPSLSRDWVGDGFGQFMGTGGCECVKCS